MCKGRGRVLSSTDRFSRLGGWCTRPASLRILSVQSRSGSPGCHHRVGPYTIIDLGMRRRTRRAGTARPSARRRRRRRGTRRTVRVPLRCRRSGPQRRCPRLHRRTRARGSASRRQLLPRAMAGLPSVDPSSTSRSSQSASVCACTLAIASARYGLGVAERHDDGHRSPSAMSQPSEPCLAACIVHDRADELGQRLSGPPRDRRERTRRCWRRCGVERTQSSDDAQRRRPRSLPPSAEQLPVVLAVPAPSTRSDTKTGNRRSILAKNTWSSNMARNDSSNPPTESIADRRMQRIAGGRRLVPLRERLRNSTRRVVDGPARRRDRRRSRRRRAGPPRVPDQRPAVDHRDLRMRVEHADLLGELVRQPDVVGVEEADVRRPRASATPRLRRGAHAVVAPVGMCEQRGSGRSSRGVAVGDRLGSRRSSRRRRRSVPSPRRSAIDARDRLVEELLAVVGR